LLRIVLFSRAHSPARSPQSPETTWARLRMAHQAGSMKRSMSPSMQHNKRVFSFLCCGINMSLGVILKMMHGYSGIGRNSSDLLSSTSVPRDCSERAHGTYPNEFATPRPRQAQAHPRHHARSSCRSRTYNALSLEIGGAAEAATCRHRRHRKVTRVRHATPTTRHLRGQPFP
jgi:hypothetical protein